MPGGLSNRAEITENRTSELEHRIAELTQSGLEREINRKQK